MEDKMLNFVIYPEEGVWVAHCLQHHIVTHGESLHEVRENIHMLLRGYEDHAPEALETAPQAATQYWELYLKAVKAGRSLDAVCDGDLETDGSYALELAQAS